MFMLLYVHVYVVRTRLDTIIEENEECSRSSSQVSVSKKSHRTEALSFSNASALKDLENELGQPTRGALPDEIGGTNLAFVNRSALELENSRTTETDFTGVSDGVSERGTNLTEVSEGLSERGAVITTSFKNVVSRRSIGDAKKGVLQPNDSPLTRYAPRSAIIPPNEVKGSKVYNNSVPLILDLFSAFFGR